MCVLVAGPNVENDDVLEHKDLWTTQELEVNRDGLWETERSCTGSKNEKELKKLYIKCHDERTIQIWTAARAAAFQTFLLLGLAAIVITGYFSITVSITILSCVLVARNGCCKECFHVYQSYNLQPQL